MIIKEDHRILCVDDELTITSSLRRVFRNAGYEIHTASNGHAGLDKINSAVKPYSLIISDQKMPGMTGIDFLERARQITPNTIRILLTGYSEIDAIIDAINKGGIHRYLTKPWDEEDILLQVRQSLKQYELIIENQHLFALTKKQNNELNELNNNLGKIVERKTKELGQREAELRQSFERLQRSFDNAIQAVSTIVEIRDPYTSGHQKQVSKIASAIARIMGLSENEVSGIKMAGLIHDIGKVAIPFEILTKPGKLDDLEFDMIKKHPKIGYDILKSIEFPYPVAQIVLQHHERIDGSGYPYGLPADDILLESKIIGVADVIDAMASHRPYRPAIGIVGAMEEITKNRSIIYDTDVVDACVSLFKKKYFHHNREFLHVLEV
jgi:putative two-component system response regulator